MLYHMKKFLYKIVFTAILSAVFLNPVLAQKITFGHLPVTGHAKIFVAKEEGFFKDEGLDVTLVEFTNSADGLSALRASKLDVGAFGTTAPLVHISKGAELSIIGGIMGEDAAIVTTAENAPKVKSVEDLKGKKIATVRLATGDAVLRGALDAKGINWKKDITLFELKNPPAVIEAVKSKQVDAGVIWGPYDVSIENQGLKVVIRTRDLAPGHPCCRITVQKKSLDDTKKWTALIRALLRAEKFTRENKAGTIEHISKYVKLDKSVLEKAYYNPNLDQSSDPNVKGVTDFWNTMVTDGFVESDLKIRDFIRVDLYNSALDSLIKANPGDNYWKKLKDEFKERNSL